MWLAVLVSLTGTAGQCFAQGEHGRRAGAELRVLAGDVRMLADLDASNSQPLIKKGLQERVRGALSAVDILLRLADQEVARVPVSHLSLVQRAFAYVDTGQWLELSELLSGIGERYPLVQTTYPDSEVLRQSAYKLHQSLCAACHDVPAQGVERPAYNLYKQVASMPESEFFARMLVGVRGDRVTGIDNPFSDADIAGLIDLYRSGMPD